MTEAPHGDGQGDHGEGGVGRHGPAQVMRAARRRDDDADPLPAGLLRDLFGANGRAVGGGQQGRPVARGMGGGAGSRIRPGAA